MLANADIVALATAKHADPFSVLGLHQVGKKFYLRAMLPGASSVEAIDVDGRFLVKLAPRIAEGFFEAELAITQRQAYQFKVRFGQADPVMLQDAFAFGAQLSPEQLIAFREGRCERPFEFLGAHPKSEHGVDGVCFALWAPNASRVSVVGSFNAWDGRRHPMRLRHDAGVWELFIPQVQVGDWYKFELLDSQGSLLPLKADPYARHAELRPGTASRVASALGPRQAPSARTAHNRREQAISIYEVHLPSWRHGANSEFPSWDELLQSLPEYVAELGFTHIELMPISEFPFDGSWGYQTLGLFAPSARFGDPAGLLRFVQASHAKGIGVLLDWVPAHFPSDSHGLARFDGTALYEYADPREGFHKDWNTLIYNFGRTEVKSFLSSSALYWVEQFGLDGLRVDAVASMLYRDYSRNAGEWLPNHLGGRENLEAISLFKSLNESIGLHTPHAATIAEESTAFPGVSAPTFAGGLGFHYKWNMGWMNDTLRYMHENPVHRRWHHDLISFGLVYAFSENYVLPISHDEVVHGKGSMLQKMPGDDWQKFANLRAYYGFMWGHPGKKLLFMGQEFAQTSEWNHQESLPWHLLDHARHKGVQTLIKDLNQLYRSTPALHQLDCQESGFQWLVLNDAENSVFAFARLDASQDAAIIVCNFTPVVRENYRLPLLDGKRVWREVLNTDSAHYGGSNIGNGAQHLLPAEISAHGRAYSTQLRLPPLAVIVLRPL
jgi:1,4-alpha-glucan branching enzyme